MVAGSSNGLQGKPKDGNKEAGRGTISVTLDRNLWDWVEVYSDEPRQGALWQSLRARSCCISREAAASCTTTQLVQKHLATSASRMHVPVLAAAALDLVAAPETDRPIFFASATRCAQQFVFSAPRFSSTSGRVISISCQ